MCDIKGNCVQFSTGPVLYITPRKENAFLVIAVDFKTHLKVVDPSQHVRKITPQPSAWRSSVDN